ncbi:MAG TPA: sulfatase-like hydrolase/transferase [Xanthobacteraceae bacterium]|nr:sulfatase-like hydrolase/transferase [Xanthobacteraceae bacterium]
MAENSGEHGGMARALPVLLRLGAILAFVLLTNGGFLQRILLLADQVRWGSLIGYLAVWAVAIAALLAVAFQARPWVRLFWAVLIALTAAVGLAYHKASGSELSAFDVISLWNARHEAARAADFYQRDLYWFALAFAGGLLVLAWPPRRRSRRWSLALAVAPLIPLLLIAGIVQLREGGGSQGLPSQFTPLAVATVAAKALAGSSAPGRLEVAFAPGVPRARKIVVLVDESVRGDYIDWTPGNPYTPELAALAPRIVDFGPASSGGNCSHYSNAILRFGAARERMGQALLTNPTLWQYAKKAGYRTVYIDGQAGFNRNPGKLQNYMTEAETKSIDAFRPLPEDVAPPDLDDRVLDIVKEELKGDGPVLIYANKNGAHFPYDRGYPEAAAKFHPTMTETPQDSALSRIASFRNAVSWTVDRFFKRLFDEVDLTDTVVLYTSDHGQQFDPSRLTHCTVEDPDPREGLVPLFVAAGDPALQQRFADGAAASRQHASHFALVPTAYELMGYRPDDIATLYPETLFAADRQEPAFTTGDIFGLFSPKVRWHPLDLGKSYLEPFDPAAAAKAP